MIRKEIIFPNNEVLKRRATTQFVNLAGRFHSRIMIEHDNKVVNGKSMLGLLSLATASNKTMILTVDGSDEAAAVAAILALLEQMNE